MNRKIMIDVGRGGRRACSGQRVEGDQAPVTLIGRELTKLLDTMGYETLFSEDVEDLASREPERGRPALCASIARQWRADCLLRLCVRASEDPSEGSVGATVHRGDRRARRLSELILRRLDCGSDLHAETVRTASCILLLRRTVCPSLILVLRLPFLQKESLSDTDATRYASCIAGGVDAWMRAGAED